MKKRLVSVVLVIVLLACTLPVAGAAGSLSNFRPTRAYGIGRFADVTGHWFAEYVEISYEHGLVDGMAAAAYAPDRNLKISEAIKLAACLHSIFATGSADFTNGSPDWYTPYVEYALSEGIIARSYPDYNANATRADFARIFAAALPDEALTAINTIGDNTIPDVRGDYTYGPAVYKLYRAGVLTGYTDHSFRPNDNIQRSEVAAITARMAVASERVSFSLSAPELSSVDISAKSAPAVFRLLVYDAYGTPLGSGSGFFISSDGRAVTNYHVIKGAASAVAVTTDGRRLDVAGIFDYDTTTDLALLQVDGRDLSYLEVGDSDLVLTGSTVYAIGYPLGLDQTFSPGSVTNASHRVDGVRYILINAAISSGSSGGALLNTAGQVIGVTTGTYRSGQNLNVALPINMLRALSAFAITPLSSLHPARDNQITVAPASISVAAGGRVSVLVTDVHNTGASVAYREADSSVVSCDWGDWSSDYQSLPLYIYGLKPGSTQIDIFLYDDYDNIIASTAVSVTVTAA